jgi:hypothetical protein
MEELLSSVDEKIRGRYRIVRLDFINGGVVDGDIISASEKTGLCLVRLKPDVTKDYNFGPDGLRIVGR